MTAAKKNKYTKILSESAVFKNAGDEIFELLLEKSQIETYNKNETIFGAARQPAGLCVLLEGSAAVLKSENGLPHVLMNRLSVGAFFGMVTLFSDSKFSMTQIHALSKCTVLKIPEPLLSEVFRMKYEVCENYIRLLTQRIRFLHTKIDAFAGSSVERKLFAFFRNHWEPAGDGAYSLNLSLSRTQLAEVLNISRASLYRVLAQLEENGTIVRRGKTFLVPEPEKMME